MEPAALTRPARLNIRATQQQKEVVARAARLTHTSISEFVLGRACRDAEALLAEQNDFSLSKPQWKALCRALDSPPRELPALRRLLAEKGVFDG